MKKRDLYTWKWTSKFLEVKDLFLLNVQTYKSKLITFFLLLYDLKFGKISLFYCNGYSHAIFTIKKCSRHFFAVLLLFMT